jgi:hypothetical protein
MLLTERAEMIHAFNSAGVQVRAETSEGEWWTATVHRQPSTVHRQP